MKYEELVESFNSLQDDIAWYWDKLELKKSIIIDSDNENTLSITVTSNKGNSYSAEVLGINLNKEILILVNELGQEWALDLDQVYDIGDKIEIIKLVEEND